MTLSLVIAAAALGVSDNPCPVPVVATPQMIAWRNAFHSGKGGVPPPAAEVAAYQAAYAEARKGDWPAICQYRGDNLRLKTMPLSMGAGCSASSTRAPVCRPTPLVAIDFRSVRCFSMWDLGGPA